MKKSLSSLLIILHSLTSDSLVECSQRDDTSVIHTLDAAQLNGIDDEADKAWWRDGGVGRRSIGRVTITITLTLILPADVSMTFAAAGNAPLVMSEPRCIVEPLRGVDEWGEH